MKEKPPQSYTDFSRIEVGTGARKKSIQSPTLYVSKEAIYLLNANWRLRTRYLKDPLLDAHEKCLILEDQKSRNKFKCYYARSSSFHTSHTGRSHKKSKLSYGDEENIPPSVEKIACSIQALIDKRKKKMNKKNGLDSDDIDERSDFEKRGRSQNSNHRQQNRFNQPRRNDHSLTRFGGTKKQRKISQQLQSFERDKEYWSSDDEEIAETVDTRDDEEIISYDPLDNHEKENEDEQHNDDESPELMDEDENELPEEPSYENDDDEELSETMNDELIDDEESIRPKKKENKPKKKRRLQRVSQINKNILQDDEHSQDDLVDSDDDDVIPSSSRKSFSNQSTTSLEENMSVAVTDEEETLTEGETQVIETKNSTQPSDQSTPKKTGPISAFFNSIKQPKTFKNKASTPSKNRTKESNTSTTPTKTSQSKSKQQQLITTKNVTPSKTTIVNPYLKKSKVYYHHGGLRNLGNSCYINSSLQLLFSLPSFFDTLKKSNEFFSEGQLYKSLMELYDQVAPPSKKGCMTCSATSIKKIMDKLSPRFAGFQQHDAHEFISEFLDSLHEELKKKSKAVLLQKEKTISSLLQAQQVQTKTPPPPQAQAVLPVVDKVVSLIEDSPEREDVAKNAQEDDGDVVIQKKTDDDNMEKEVKAPVSSPIVLPTDTYFCMKIKVCLTCDKCGYSRNREELFRHISLDIDNSKTDSSSNNDTNEITVEKALEHYFTPEKRDLHCEKCKKGKSATQSLKITKMPRGLLLHLKRFELQPSTSHFQNNMNNNNGITFRKSFMPVSYPQKLDLTKFLDSSSTKPTTTTMVQSSGKDYSLRALVNHIGPTLDSGHYTSEGLRLQGNGKQEWMYFDDRNVKHKEMSDEATKKNKKDVYMVLYELK